ncbi:type II toxin-antitoxin system RelE/ParE family toxin [Nocardiopsis dassonvillei]|uniref:type II toxin-antitoxin system RelE/ParE family toxin n=1 Tax=Nocardiopsis dassonvillei TaxID=2014 RepID=UPI00157CA95B|nr:type II toxin-antitoxin system RelE/ParE family toxin [Nocardiopsis dassonvillei]
MWEILMLEPVEEWYLKLRADDPVTATRFDAALSQLESHGPDLTRPLADRVKGSRIHNLKELRPGASGRSEIRVLFVFDPERQAVLLVAGDKSGQWNRWYQKNIPVAEQRYLEHLRRRKDEQA